MATGKSRLLLAGVIVAMLSGLLFTVGLPGDFVFDDHPNIVNNETIHLTKLDRESLLRVIATPQLSGETRLLPTLTFALDYWRGGGADPATFKSTNILIHALAALALMWVFRSLLLISGIHDSRTRWLAPALALAWAMHPLQVSSVLYAVQRLQTMGTLFLILALLAYLHARQAQMKGQPGRTGLMLTALLWVLAMGCKEDSILLPAYTLAMELTVLRFNAQDTRLAGTLKRTYLLTMAVGAACFLFLVIPWYWQWDAYGGRDFSTPERLLTQARVLAMYLWQILVPMPSHMPFYYDWLTPSRGLLQPWTTLLSILAIAGLLIGAWRLRSRQPLFALGIFLFFSAHFVTSNVIGLELAFEHRNHFALIGAVLAAGSLLADISLRLRLPPSIQALACIVILASLGGATAIRAHSWNSKLSLALVSTRYAPHSARAWMELCSTYFRMGGDPTPENSHLDQAIAACSTGAALAPYALNNSALLIVLKTLRGDIAATNWNDFQHRLETVQMSADNQRAPTILTYHSRRGVRIDKQQLLKALSTLERRGDLQPFNLASIGYFVMNDLTEPDLAIPYFIRAIHSTPAGDPFRAQLAAELDAKGRPDLAEKIRQLANPPYQGRAPAI